MQADEFTERLGHIRQRFATTLSSKVDDSFACLPKLAETDGGAIDTIVVIHRKLHELCGLAPTIGFTATGKAARAAESVLREAAETKRSLTSEEVTAFIAELGGLRVATQSDLKTSPMQIAF